jgi:hypothetical protein
MRTKTDDWRLLLRPALQTPGPKVREKTTHFPYTLNPRTDIVKPVLKHLRPMATERQTVR